MRAGHDTQKVWDSARLFLYETTCDEFAYSYGGTGFLVQWSGTFFLVTAAHVINAGMSNGHCLDRLFVTNPLKPLVCLGICSKHWISRLNGMETDLPSCADVVLLRVAPSSIEDAATSAYDLSRVCGAEVGAHCHAVGFPSGANNGPVSQIDYDDQNISPARQIIEGIVDRIDQSSFSIRVTIPTGPIKRPSGILVPVQYPRDLDGMSGSPVFGEDGLIGMTIQAGYDSIGLISAPFIREVVRRTVAQNANESKVTNA